MRDLSRREFLRLCITTGAALSLSELLLPEIIEAFGSGEAGRPPVVWLQGGSCSGCSVSLLNSVSPEIGDALTKVINLRFHQTLMAANGEMAIGALRELRQKYRGEYVLVVEGSVPVGAKGRFATLGEEGDQPIAFMQWVKAMSRDAKAVVAVGTCAAFGGIPAGKPNPTGSLPVSAIISGVPVINIPGCPNHPDWFFGTIVHLVKYGVPKLDHLRRPTLFYQRCVHDICERRPDFDRGIFASSLSDPGCLYKLGCKGPMAFADCPQRKFNNGTNWCVEAGSPCLACVEPGFPDTASPFFVRMPEYGPAETSAPVARQISLLGGEK